MNLSRIAELLKPFLAVEVPPSASSGGQVGSNGEEGQRSLPPAELQSISMYVDILLHWNARINLTAVRDEEEIVRRHFGESLFMARQLFPAEVGVAKPVANAAAKRSSSVRLADLGSGAGFPGIPVKLWAPDIALTLIESSLKKATFLREVVRALGLTGVEVKNDRAEALSPATFEIVTIRAVERLSEVLPVAAALLAQEGRLALLVSEVQLQPVRSRLPKISWDPPVAIPQSRSRVVLVGVAEASADRDR